MIRTINIFQEYGEHKFKESPTPALSMKTTIQIIWKGSITEIVSVAPVECHPYLQLKSISEVIQDNLKVMKEDYKKDKREAEKQEIKEERKIICH